MELLVGWIEAVNGHNAGQRSIRLLKAHRSRGKQRPSRPAGHTQYLHCLDQPEFEESFARLHPVISSALRRCRSNEEPSSAKAIR